MTDKAKPPQPMAFKNLAELKRYIKLGTEFKATRHKYHPDIDPCSDKGADQRLLFENQG